MGKDNGSADHASGCFQGKRLDADLIKTASFTNRCNDSLPAFEEECATSSSMRQSSCFTKEEGEKVEDFPFVPNDTRSLVKFRAASADVAVPRVVAIRTSNIRSTAGSEETGKHPYEKSCNSGLSSFVFGTPKMTKGFGFDSVWSTQRSPLLTTCTEKLIVVGHGHRQSQEEKLSQKPSCHGHTLQRRSWRSDEIKTITTLRDADKLAFSRIALIMDSTEDEVREQYQASTDFKLFPCEDNVSDEEETVAEESDDESSLNYMNQDETTRLWELRMVRQLSWRAIQQHFPSQSLVGLETALGNLMRNCTLRRVAAPTQAMKPSKRSNLSSASSSHFGAPNSQTSTERAALALIECKTIPANIKRGETTPCPVYACSKDDKWSLGTSPEEMSILVAADKHTQSRGVSITESNFLAPTCEFELGTGSPSVKNSKIINVEDNVLIELHKAGVSWSDIAARLGRTVGSIRKRWYVLRQQAKERGEEVDVKFPTRSPGRPPRVSHCQKVGGQLMGAEIGLRKKEDHFDQETTALISKTRVSRSLERSPYLAAKYAAIQLFVQQPSSGSEGCFSGACEQYDVTTFANVTHNREGQQTKPSGAEKSSSDSQTWANAREPFREGTRKPKKNIKHDVVGNGFNWLKEGSSNEVKALKRVCSSTNVQIARKRSCCP